MCAVHFTSDLHFGHARVIEHARRPFASVDDMDAALADNWRRAVAPGDRVYILGDLSFHKPDRTLSIVSSLPGQKFLILGNHDRIDGAKWEAVRRCFVWIRPYEEIAVDDQKIVLLHYALRVWNRSHHGSWHLYGHSHGSLVDDPHARSMDVGVDAHAARLSRAREDYRPMTLAGVAAHMATKAWRPVDHHGAAEV